MLMVLAYSLPFMSVFVNLRPSFLPIHLCFISGCQNQRGDPSKPLQVHLVTLLLPGLLPEICISQWAQRAYLSNWCGLAVTPATTMPLLPCASRVCQGNPWDNSCHVFELTSHCDAFTQTNFISINRAVGIDGLFPCDVNCWTFRTSDCKLFGALHYLPCLLYQTHQDRSQLKVQSVIRLWIIKIDNNGRHY